MSEPGPEWFRAPGQRFYPAAFWFWHRIPTAGEIVDQLADMRAKGISEVMIQARPALGLDHYLSPIYLAAYRTAAAEAGRLGLRMTIYDEYGWMSGHGGGRTVRGADHLRERHLFWTSVPAGENQTDLTVSHIRAPFLDFLGATGRDWLYEDGAPRWGDWQTVLVVAHPNAVIDPTEIEVLDGPSMLADQGPASCRLTAAHGELPPGTTITAFVSARCLTSRLINYLLPEAAQRFAETVYRPLVTAASGHAQTIFFDHPHAGFYVWDEHRGELGNSLLWEGGAASACDAGGLLALVTDVGPGTAALRAAYLERYCQRLHDAFFGTLSRWAQAAGLGFTGHELLTHVGGWALHDGLTGFDPRVMPGTDYFGIDRYRSETTVDAADYDPQLSAKMGDSVARAHGRSRCAVEQYSTGRSAGRATLAGRWDLSAAEFRAQAIRHLLFGARRIVLHAINVTDGTQGDDRLLVNPRFDFPPAFNFEPWWADCPAIFAELARVSAFLEEGEPLRPVALLYPLETIRVGGPTHPCGQHFGWWAAALARRGLGYDIIDESMLARALGPGTHYAVLVLPHCEALAQTASATAIAAFVSGGGQLLVSGAMPERARDGDLAESLAASTDHATMITTTEADAATIEACVATLLVPRPSAGFADGGPTWCSVARYGPQWRLVSFNDADAPRQLEIRSAGPLGAVAVWNAATGDIEDHPCAGADHVSLTVKAQEVVCLTLQGDVSAHRDASGPIFAFLRREATETGATFVLDDGWTFESDGRSPTPIRVDRGWEQQGFAAFSGTGIYRRRVTIPTTETLWQMVLPALRDTAELWVNGTLVGRHISGEARFTLPPETAELDLEVRVRNTGANRYYAGSVHGPERPTPSGLIEPPRLVAVSPPSVRSAEPGVI